MTNVIPKRDIVAEYVADNIRGYAHAVAREAMAVHQCNVHEDHEACAKIAGYTDDKFKYTDMLANSILDLTRLRVRPTEVEEVLKRDLRALEKRVHGLAISKELLVRG